MSADKRSETSEATVSAEHARERAQAILKDAVAAGASDAHLAGRPGDEALVRLRVDGVLHDHCRMPVAEHVAVAEQLRVMAGLDPDERTLPQDGRIVAEHEGRTIAFRVSVLPCHCGDAITIRILDAREITLDLDALGYTPEVLATARKLAKAPAGLFIVTGPTGSGKTTLLYALATELAARGDLKVMTVEDPVELALDGMEQVQIRPDAGLTFPRVVRAMLRSDPDVILCGEIRDRETAMMLCQAALTGHLVLTTLHTRSAAEVPERLINIGVAPFILGGCLLGAIGQRLVRRLRPETRMPDPATADKLQLLGAEGRWFSETFLMPSVPIDPALPPYKGRLPVNDVLVVDNDVRKLIYQGASTESLRRLMREKGTAEFLTDGLAKAAAGETSLDELLNVGIGSDWGG